MFYFSVHKGLYSHARAKFGCFVFMTLLGQRAFGVSLCQDKPRERGREAVAKPRLHQGLAERCFACGKSILPSTESSLPLRYESITGYSSRSIVLTS